MSAICPISLEIEMEEVVELDTPGIELYGYRKKQDLSLLEKLDI
jgi:hypothetical protein